MPGQCKENSLGPLTGEKQRKHLFRGEEGRAFQAEGSACVKTGCHRAGHRGTVGCSVEQDLSC